MNKLNKKIESADFDKDRFFTLTEDLFLIIDSEGTIRWSNPGAESWFNDQPDRNIFRIVHPAEIENLKTRISQLSLGNTVPSFEMRLLSKNIGFKWYLWNAAPHPENGLYYFAGRDITPHKQYEEETRLIYHTSRAFGESDNLEDSLQLALNEICRITNWPYAEAFTKDPYSERLVRIASWHDWTSSVIEFDEMHQDFTFSAGEGIIGKAWVGQQPRWVENLYEEKDFLRKSSAKKAHLNSMFLIPVTTSDETVAVMVFFMFVRNPENERLVKLISAIVSQLSNLIERKKIEGELRKSERLLRNAEKMAHIGSWEYDPDKKILFWSDEMFIIFGLPSGKQIDFDDFAGLFSSEGAKKFSDAVKEIANTFEPFIQEHFIIRPPNDKRFLYIKGEALQDTDKNSVKIIGTVQDITSEKKVTEMLIKSELYYRSLIENSLDLKMIVNHQGLIKFISQSVERIIGYTPSELLHNNLNDYVHPDDLEILNTTFSNLSQPGTLISVEFRFRNSTGNFCTFECIMKNLSHVPYVEGIIINSRDITAKKNAETAIKTLMEISWKLNSTLDTDELMDILVTEAMKLIDAEMGTAGLRTAEGLTSRKIYTGSKWKDVEYFWAPGQGIPGRVLEQKKVYINNEIDKSIDEVLIRNFDIMNLICVPILDAHNRGVGFFQLMNRKQADGFSDSDSERLQALAQTASTVIQNALAYQKILMTEAQLKNSREQLRRLSAHLQSAREEERTRIAREIHDELGQALTGLKMDLSWLDKKLKGSENDKTGIISKLESMGNLVDGTIKTVRKISSELRPGVLDYLGLAAAIEWQAQDFQNRTGIVCSIDSGAADFDLDQNSSTAVFRIFQETLTNVARHSKATQVNIKMDIEEENFVLEISDNGRGITESEIYNNKSLGLLGMRERANLIGGDFHIKGTSTGTVVSVIIPYNQYNPGVGL